MTMKAPKLPFKLYAIDDIFGEAKIQSVTVNRITPTKWWFAPQTTDGLRGSGLAFGCRTGCSPFAFSLTPKAAWQAYRAHAIEHRDNWAGKVLTAEKALARLK